MLSYVKHSRPQGPTVVHLLTSANCLHCTLEAFHLTDCQSRRTLTLSRLVQSIQLGTFGVIGECRLRVCDIVLDEAQRVVQLVRGAPADLSQSPLHALEVRPSRAEPCAGPPISASSKSPIASAARMLYVICASPTTRVAILACSVHVMPAGLCGLFPHAAGQIPQPCPCSEPPFMGPPHAVQPRIMTTGVIGGLASFLTITSAYCSTSPQVRECAMHYRH